MVKIIAFYKLKPGITIDEFREWSVSVDQKTALFQPGVYRFEVYSHPIKGAGEGEASHQIIEDVEVESFEAWEKILKSEAMKKVVDTWGDYCDESTLEVTQCTRLK